MWQDRILRSRLGNKTRYRAVTVRKRSPFVPRVAKHSAANLLSKHGLTASLGPFWKALPLMAAIALFDIVWIGPNLRVGWDFPQFWAMARIPLSDRADPDNMIAQERVLLSKTVAPDVVPYVRPQAFSLILKPLAWLDLVPAFRVWVVLQVAALGALLWKLRRITGAPWPMLALVGLYKPAVMGVAMGQDIAVVALLSMLAFVCLKTGRDSLAGFLFGLCLYKFNLFWTIPLFLLANKRWQALTVFGITGAVLAAVSCWIMPAGNYLAYLGNIGKYQPAYNPATLGVGLKGIAALFGYPSIYFVLAPLLLASAYWGLRLFDEELGFALLLTISLFCGYYVTEYDYTLLLIPVFILMKRSFGLYRALSIGALAVPFVWLYPLPQLSFLAAFAGAMLVFAWRAAAVNPNRGWQMV